MKSARTHFLSVFVLLGLIGSASAQVPNTTTIITDGHVVTDTYAAKFICGVQGDTKITSMPDAQAGRYSTKVNVHNNTGTTINFRKKAIRLRGGEVPLAPAEKKPLENLKPDWAMEVVCTDIYALIGMPFTGQAPPPYIEGFLIFEVYWPTETKPPVIDPLDVIGVYTYKGDLPSPTAAPNGSGVSIEVVPYPVKRNAHPL